MDVAAHNPSHAARPMTPPVTSRPIVQESTSAHSARTVVASQNNRKSIDADAPVKKLARKPAANGAEIRLGFHDVATF